jgi:hypothetical protein
MSENEKNLYYLEELSDYEVATDYSDVRGWDVVDTNNRIIGKVDKLLVNKRAERVVYLDVEVDKAIIEDGYQTFEKSTSEGIHGFLNNEGDDHLIIPIGMATLDEANNQVISNQIDYDTFAKVSRFSKGSTIDSKYEIKVFRDYTGDESSEISPSDQSFYDRKEFENTWKRKFD